jgi:hypothetical protein
MRIVTHGRPGAWLVRDRAGAAIGYRVTDCHSRGGRLAGGVLSPNRMANKWLTAIGPVFMDLA